MADESPSGNGAAHGRERNGATESALNAQILEAIERSKAFAVDAPAVGITRQQVAQACALAIQDAADYQRNVMSVSNVAQGKALAMMMANPAFIEQYAAVLTLAMISPIAAALTAGIVAREAALTLDNFPKA
jgi:hypothetical protein